MRPIITTSIVADVFRQILQGWLTPEELAAVDAENERRGDNTCASHDYCDPNMAMMEAMQRFDLPWPTDEDGEIRDEEYNEAHCALWNEAWGLAKARGFNTPVNEED